MSDSNKAERKSQLLASVKRSSRVVEFRFNWREDEQTLTIRGTCGALGQADLLPRQSWRPTQATVADLERLEFESVNGMSQVHVFTDNRVTPHGNFDEL